MASVPVFRKSLGINTAIEPHRLVYLEDGSCPFAEGVNIIIDDSGSFKRRFGIEKLHDAGSHSLWAKGNFCFFISAGDLYRITTSGTVVLVLSSVGDIPMYYELMHGKVYCSNGLVQLVITDTTITDWVANVPSQMKGDDRVLGMPTGFTRLLVHAGRMFVVTENKYLWQSEPGNPGCFVLSDYPLPFGVIYDFISIEAPGDYTSSKGIYLSCDEGVLFLEGAAKVDFTRSITYTKRAIPGTMRIIDGADLADGKEFDGPMVIWVSEDGVCLGDNRGKVVNKTSRNLVFSKIISGAGVIIPGQYLFSLEVE